MASPTVTYTFSNSTTADATQVNTNFTDAIAWITGGLIDYSVLTLAVASTATFNGNVTLGNATGDDITFTGSIASSVPIKTTYSYDIGSSTIGIRSIYFGDAGSAARCTRVIGNTIASGYTLTLPDTSGSIGQVPVNQGSGSLIFRHFDKFTASKTSAYTATGDETIIPVDSSGGTFDVTIPAASSTLNGKRLTILKTDTSLTAVGLITGITSSVNTEGEAVTIACNGSTWYVVERYIPHVWRTYTPTFTGFGTVNTHSIWWARVGDSLKIRGKFTSGTSTGVEARISFPGSITSDSTKVTGLQGAGIDFYGTAGAASYYTLIDSGVAYLNFGVQNSGSAGLSKANGNTFSANGEFISFTFECPITGWNG